MKTLKRNIFVFIVGAALIFSVGFNQTSIAESRISDPYISTNDRIEKESLEVLEDLLDQACEEGLLSEDECNQVDINDFTTFCGWIADHINDPGVEGNWFYRWLYGLVLCAYWVSLNNSQYL